MRVFGANAPAVLSAPASARRRTTTGEFALAEEPVPQTAAAAALRTISIEALLALQGEVDPAARRRQAVKRGQAALAALDELKLGLLVGTLSPSTLLRLKAAAAELRESSGAPDLDTLLAEIALRVEVEIAKLAP